MERCLSEVNSTQSVIGLNNTFLNTDSVFRDRLLEVYGDMKLPDQLKTIKQNKLTFAGCKTDSGVTSICQYLDQLKTESVFDFYTETPESGLYILLEKPNENNTSILKFIENLS